MDRLDTLSLFVRIVDRSGFTAAAADLGVSRPAATAAIQALEARLGARLLHRTTRHVRPTAEGETYYQHCVRRAGGRGGGRPERERSRVGRAADRRRRPPDPHRPPARAAPSSWSATPR